MLRCATHCSHSLRTLLGEKISCGNRVPYPRAIRFFGNAPSAFVRHSHLSDRRRNLNQPRRRIRLIAIAASQSKMSNATNNTERFTGRAEDYDRFRQRYPTQEILSRLQAWCGLEPNWRIADIGAGTGMLAEVFLENSNPVLAVEPNADMRQYMRTLFAPPHPLAPQLEILDATAEATTISAASIDMVAAGRAFHWFDERRALAEFRRILKPTGWVALISQSRAHQSTDPDVSKQIAAFEHLLIAHGTDYKYIRSGYRSHDNMQALFGSETELHQDQIAGTQQLDWAAFRGNTMSLSVTPQPGHANDAAFQRELLVFFDTFAVDGALTIPTTCWITAARYGPH
jgi:ubiquinone/menaquinone biosynthesis C-methylase UbiE